MAARKKKRPANKKSGAYRMTYASQEGTQGATITKMAKKEPKNRSNTNDVMPCGHTERKI